MTAVCRSVCVQHSSPFSKVDAAAARLERDHSSRSARSCRQIPTPLCASSSSRQLQLSLSIGAPPPLPQRRCVAQVAMASRAIRGSRAHRRPTLQHVNCGSTCRSLIRAANVKSVECPRSLASCQCRLCRLSRRTKSSSSEAFSSGDFPSPTLPAYPSLSRCSGSPAQILQNAKDEHLMDCTVHPCLSEFGSISAASA